MSEGSAVGRHYLSGKPQCISWADGKIDAVNDLGDCPENQWLAPALVDVQVNGYAGVDFQRDDTDAEGLLKAVRGMSRDGCRRWMLTLITDKWESLLERLAGFKKLRDQSPELREAIVGWHVEGPFLSEEPGFRGAHNSDVMQDPAPERMDELKQITGDDAVLVTLAAERASAIPSIERAIQHGFVVSIGHSNATAEQLASAVSAGADGFTHLGNGMPQAMDRHDNIVGRVFDSEGLMAGVIPDRIHVSPQLFRLIHKALPADRIYYTTDCMSAAGAPPGDYTVGDNRLHVGEDQIVRIPGQSNFAGSALRPVQGIERAAEMLQRTWRDVWDFGSLNPAKLMRLSSGLEVGDAADLCLVHGTSTTLDRVELL